MPKRRYHEKSRGGCAQCKRRRVKCDEARPTCERCFNTGKTCAYASLDGPQLQPSKPSSEPKEDPELVRLPRAPLAFDLLDLSIMNHFTVSTAPSLFAGEKQRVLWQTTIPQEAQKSAMLMHGLLSIGASHLSRLKQDSKERALLSTRALHHHGLSLALYNQEIASLSPENTGLLLSYAVMLVIWVYASLPRDDGQVAPGFERLIDMLDIVHSTKTVFHVHKSSIKWHAMDSFRDPCDEQSMLRDPAPADECFVRMRAATTHPGDNLAIDSLQFSLQNFVDGHGSVKDAVAWPAHLDDVFWARVKQRMPGALLVFAHYALLVRCYEVDCWWIEGWSGFIVSAIEEVLRDGKARGQLDWVSCKRAMESAYVKLAESAISNAKMQV